MIMIIDLLHTPGFDPATSVLDGAFHWWITIGFATMAAFGLLILVFSFFSRDKYAVVGALIFALLGPLVGAVLGPFAVLVIVGMYYSPNKKRGR